MTDDTLIFTPEALAAMAVAPGDQAIAALDEGRPGDARAIAEATIDAHFVTRDIYVFWNAMTTEYIRREFGEAALAEALVASLRTIVRPYAELFRNGVSREAVTSIAQLVRMDAGQLEGAEEDAVKIVLTSQNWNGAQVAALPMPLPDSKQVLDVVERLCVDWLGYPAFTFEGGADGEPLRTVIWKDPLDVPQAAFDRLGVVRDVARIGAAFAVSGMLLFDQDELEEMRLQTHALAVRAIDAGDDVRARRQLHLSKTEWYPGHHFLRDWVTAQGSWIHEHHGVEHVWNSVEEGYNRPIMATMLADLKQMSFEEQVPMLAGLFHQHAMKYELTETEDKFVFHTTPCGSGGRLVDEGAYAAPKNFATVRGPGLESFGLEERVVSSTNRNFENRQGPRTRTHLASPATVAASAIVGALADVRQLPPA